MRAAFGRVTERLGSDRTAALLDHIREYGDERDRATSTDPSGSWRSAGRARAAGHAARVSDEPAAGEQTWIISHGASSTRLVRSSQ